MKVPGFVTMVRHLFYIKMKNITFLLIFLVSAPFFMAAQDMSKFYISSPRADGILYFVMPQKMPYEKKQSNPRKELSYDFTFVDEDSVTMLATITSAEAFVPAAIKITADNNEVECPVSLLFCDPEKSHWVTRVKCTMSYDQWTKIVQSNSSPRFDFVNDDSGIVYYYSSKDWRKLREKYVKLLTTVKLNNKK